MVQPCKDNDPLAKNHSCQGPCFLQKFSLAPKVGMRICLYGFFAVGIVGVLLENLLYQ